MSANVLSRIDAPLVRAAPQERLRDAIRPASATNSAARARPRLLVSAYACDPRRGSEHGVGWNWTRELSRHADLWVATRANRRAAIEAWELANGQLGVRWVYLEGPRWLLWLKKHGLGIHGYYHCWQRLLSRTARELHGQYAFDAVFHLTMNGFREPGYLWRLPCPFVWGPIGGLQDADPAFLVDEPVRTRVLERARRWLNRAMARWSARPRSARARAALLMAANGDSLTWARGGGTTAQGRRVVRLLEAGVVEQPRSCARASDEILWVGSDERRKNPRFALKAFALLRHLRPALRLTMVGVSARRQQELRAWATSRGCALTGVAFHERVPRPELADFYSRATLFWFTSYRDTSGNVLLEALSSGAPCLAFDHQGAADILADGAGQLVPVGSPAAMLRGWTRASLRLIDDASARERMSVSGHALVRERFAWSRKPDALLALLAHRAEI